jgi:hypothetical protein
MITLQQGTYVAKCDGCEAELDAGLRSFHRAINLMSRVEGWANRRAGGQWWNFCPRCEDAANPELDRGVGSTKAPDDRQVMK